MDLIFLILFLADIAVIYMSIYLVLSSRQFFYKFVSPKYEKTL